jgi:hypothetical protein
MFLGAQHGFELVPGGHQPGARAEHPGEKSSAAELQVPMGSFRFSRGVHSRFSCDRAAVVTIHRSGREKQQVNCSTIMLRPHHADIGWRVGALFYVSDKMTC